MPTPVFCMAPLTTGRLSMTANTFSDAGSLGNITGTVVTVIRCLTVRGIWPNLQDIAKYGMLVISHEQLLCWHQTWLPRISTAVKRLFTGLHCIQTSTWLCR